jgi:uncharacterized protein
MIPELSLTQWFVLAGSALAIGLSKTGLPGATIVAIPLLAQCFSAKASTGLVLPMLVCADLVAVSYYRRKADVSHLIHLIPWAALGVVIGSVWLGRIGDAQLMPLIGAIVLLMLGLNHWRRRVERPDAIVPRTWWLAGAVGLVAGITTMMANAAGPIMIVYFLAMRLPKESFVGTGAWYFFLLNLFKLPFSANLGLIHRESLMLNALALPLVVAGALAGIAFLHRIPQRKFTWAVEFLAVLAAIRLLLS